MSAKAFAAALLLWAPLMAQDAILFERDFPGAVPEWFSVRLERNGTAAYTEGEGHSAELEIGEAAAREIFELAAELDYFTPPLASRRRVASTGQKRLRYEVAGEVRGEAVFDYSENPRAREIASWFVKLTETQQHLWELERVLRFDRLGVNQALVNLEQAYERDRIVAADLLVPILGKIGAHQGIVHLARARAKGLLEKIAAKPGRNR